MTALPQGALEQLLSPEGGQAAFDKAIADSQAQTQALMKPTVAPNAYNESKRAEHAAQAVLARHLFEEQFERFFPEQAISHRYTSTNGDLSASAAQRGALTNLRHLLMTPKIRRTVAAARRSPMASPDQRGDWFESP